MKTGDQNISYIKSHIGIYEESLVEKLELAFLFLLLILGSPIIAAIVYYHESTLNGLGFYLVVMSVIGIWVFRVLYKARVLRIEFNEHEIRQVFRGIKQISIPKNELISAKINLFKGGYILALSHSRGTTNIVMNRNLINELNK